MEELRLLGLKVHAAEMWELHQEISRIIGHGGPGYVLSANIHGFNLARRMPWLADFYNRADLVHCDGAGIMLGARILGRKIPVRLTYADWGWDLARYCAGQGHSLFLLGGPQGVAEEAAAKLRHAVPNLCVKGTHHGYFAKAGEGNKEIIALINRAAPDILMVGLGMGLQERWILDNRDKLTVKVYMVCGAAFRYWAGRTRRCPRWMADHGLEWLYRFLQEPKRMAARYLLGNPIFLLNVLKQRFLSGRRGV